MRVGVKDAVGVCTVLCLLRLRLTLGRRKREYCVVLRSEHHAKYFPSGENIAKALNIPSVVICVSPLPGS